MLLVKNILQNMTMTPRLVLIAVAHESHPLASRERLKQAQCEFLAVILDVLVPFVDGSGLK